MKNIYLMLFLCCLCTAACKKEVDAPTPPVSEFYLGDPSLSSYVVNEATTIVPLNNSTDAVSYLWDLGNGATSTERTPSIYFGKGGEYTVSLTVTKADGTTSTSKREVKVLTPVVRSIIINDINKWVGLGSSTLDKFNGGDVWVEVYKVDNKGSYSQLSNGAFNYPLHFKSEVIKNLSADLSQSIVLAVPENANLTEKLSRVVDFRYVFSLFVKDTSGTHLLFSSEYTGSSFMPGDSNFDFNWTSTFNNTKVTIPCRFQ
jgi:PKD repeat protein